MNRLSWLPAALILAANALASSAVAAVPPEERAALVALHDSAAGAGWTTRTNWLTDDPCENNWFGVICINSGGTHHVSELHLSNNNLIGTLPDLSSLTELIKFNVSDNQLTGPIAGLADLPKLQAFWGSNNQFIGLLPDLPRMTTLEYFWVNSNQLVGPIPPIEGLAALKDFRVANNMLTGTQPVAPPPIDAATPTSLNSGGSTLCPNYLHVPDPRDPAVDEIWNWATGSDPATWPWDAACDTPGYLVTPSAGAGGSIDAPLPQAVLAGETVTFTLAADADHTIQSVGGTCGGTLAGDTFTTHAVTADCTVVATFRGPPAPAAIPTLSHWAMMLMGLLAAGLGLWRLRHR